MGVAKFESKKVKRWINKIEKDFGRVVRRDKTYVHIIGTLVFQDVMDHFKKERGPKKKWQKWSDVYKAHRKRIGKGKGQKLQDTGTMRNSFRPTNYKASKKGIMWFNPTVYSRTHDEGDPKRNIPQRQFMWLSKGSMKAIERNTLAYLGGLK